MGGCFSSENGNGEANVMSKLDEDDIVSSKRRSCTDVFCLLTMPIFLLSVVILVGYCAAYSDIARVLYGYDNCANVCGKVTLPDKNPEYRCKGANHTTRPFLLVRGTGRAIVNPVHSRRECVSSCSEQKGFRQFITRCIPFTDSDIIKGGIEKAASSFSFAGLSDFLEETSEDLHLCWREMVYMCLIALGFSFVLLLLFRYVIGFVIWFVLVGVVLTTLTATVYMWYLWKRAKDEVNKSEFPDDFEVGKVKSYLVFAIASTVVCLIVILIIFVMRKRINLLVRLFKEAGKAVRKMPFLLLQPLLSFWVLAVIIGIWVGFTLVIQGSGYVAEKSLGNLYYKKTFAMKFARFYNLFALFWVVQFVVGCQHMVIAGAVAKWFFTRNKDELNSPIIHSFSNLVRFHLGSVAFGSFFIALIQMIRAVLSFIEERCKNSENNTIKQIARIVQCCLSCCENILKYFTRNAYVEIAIHGVNFCHGGQKAFRLITSNVLRVATINSVGDFILFLGKVLVVVSTILIGIVILKSKEGIIHVWVPIALAGIFAFIVSHCFITVYEMVIDTIFVCFCEDYEMNDGVNKPYYMSKGLMEFVQSSKRSLNGNN
ncbi:hypothetical protein RUM44_013793 [Polyplax serrata]|uniref:Choline transporter-like protein n=1 Tax=Polyplax serrata TaxID=468196 RepID=A0ABR1BHC0_POLSC